MEKLRNIAFSVLSNYQDEDLRKEEIRIEIANVIEERWRNVVKEVAKNELTKKAIESIENRMGKKLINASEEEMKKVLKGTNIITK